MVEQATAQSPGPAVRLAATWDGPPGAPVLVLGNSLGTTGELWRPNLAALAARFRVLRFEHRGHGGSAAPPGPYTIAGLGRDVLALLDESGAESVSYCGVSLGGMIGMWLAANAPGRIEALGLCCTSAYLPPAQVWADRAAGVRGAGMASISGQVVERWFTPAFRARDPATVAAFVATLDGVEPEGYAGCCEAIAAMDLRPSLGSITAPTLVVAGAEDPATPPWHAAVIASGIKGSRLRVIRGGAHLANVSHPSEVTAALLAHLTAAAGRQSQSRQSQSRQSQSGAPARDQAGQAGKAAATAGRQAVDGGAQAGDGREPAPGGAAVVTLRSCRAGR